MVDLDGSPAERVAFRFRALFFLKRTSGGRANLQIVENRREGDVVRQQVIATLGRPEDLRESG